eukprot:s805_g25.t1
MFVQLRLGILAVHCYGLILSNCFNYNLLFVLWPSIFERPPRQLTPPSQAHRCQGCTGPVLSKRQALDRRRFAAGRAKCDLKSLKFSKGHFIELYKSSELLACRRGKTGKSIWMFGVLCRTQLTRQKLS